MNELRAMQGDVSSEGPVAQYPQLKEPGVLNCRCQAEEEGEFLGWLRGLTFQVTWSKTESREQDLKLL